MSSVTDIMPEKSRAKLDYTTAEAGNPFVEGWYADPGSAVYDGVFWVYATSSCAPEDQTQIDAFSSSDLIHWTKHPGVLKTADVPWATNALKAPTPISRNGKYYLYFSANDTRKDKTDSKGGIGVAVADGPEGPFIDVIGKPLIGSYHNDIQPVDQDVFIDDADGTAYLYYGGNARVNVAVLGENMDSLGTFNDGTTYKEITPKNYTHGPKMVKRNGTYYFMWSEGGRDSLDSSIAYAMADNPLGPFNRLGAMLQADSAVAKGIGHNSVINIPDADIWYILYHRLPLRETGDNDSNNNNNSNNNKSKDHRVLAYDRMYFNNEDNTIPPIAMLVKDNFADGAMLAWTAYGGQWRVEDSRLASGDSGSGMALLDTNFADVVFDATIATTSGTGHPGLLFRVHNLSTTPPYLYKGYKAALSPAGVVTLGKADMGTFTDLAQTRVDALVPHAEYRVRVVAVGCEIAVFVGDLGVPKIRFRDEGGDGDGGEGWFRSGANGVRVFDVAARFGFVSVARPSAELCSSSFLESREGKGEGEGTVVDHDDSGSSACSWDDGLDKHTAARSDSENLGRKGAETEAEDRLPRFSFPRLFCGTGWFSKGG